MTRTRGTSLPVLFLALGVAGLDAQTLPTRQESEPTVRLQPTLEVAAGRFARAWATGDPTVMGGYMASGGVRLHLLDATHPSLSPRQVVAALRSFLEEHETRAVQVVRASEVGGDPARGFAELAWNAVTAGTVEQVSHTVYVGFVLEEGWKVTEVRVMR